MRILAFTMICVSMFFSGCCKDGINITVKKKLNSDIDRYHTAKINVQDDNYKTNTKKSTSAHISDNDRLYIDGVLFWILKGRGISRSFGDTEGIDLKVECLFRRRIGCPDVGAHLNIDFEHISWVNIKLIDMKTNQIIGEVECRKPFFKKLPSKFIELMFDELMKKP